MKIYSLLFDTVGFYARNVEDLELLADVFALADDEPVPEPFGIRGAKFAILKTMVWPQAGPGTLAAMEAAEAALRKHGAVVEHVELPPAFDLLPQWHRTWLTCEGRVSFLPEYAAAKDKLGSFLVGNVENRQKISRAEQVEAFDGIASLRPKMDELAGKYAAIVTPSAVDEAPLGIEQTGSSAFNKIWTVRGEHHGWTARI